MMRFVLRLGFDTYTAYQPIRGSATYLWLLSRQVRGRKSKYTIASRLDFEELLRLMNGIAPLDKWEVE